MKIIIILLLLSAFSRLAYSQCEVEKKQVDNWNKVLKNKVTEWARKKHRVAKKEFLDCLRQPNKESPTQSPIRSSPSKPAPSKPEYKFAPIKSAKHVTVSDYANFKGKKKLAWSHYFKESDECLSNKNDMKLFVACAKVRKQQLKTFNSRWNDQTQALMPLLDN
ncbi:hypothetical protein [uncultured Paraglaciecola sp.]|uniref:hypothetical protein n=1 Tax=uncultured Paraglaciecola sp. TaxID=1765024 RepID=UPI0030D95D1F